MNMDIIGYQIDPKDFLELGKTSYPSLIKKNGNPSTKFWDRIREGKILYYGQQIHYFDGIPFIVLAELIENEKVPEYIEIPDLGQPKFFRVYDSGSGSE